MIWFMTRRGGYSLVRQGLNGQRLISAKSEHSVTREMHGAPQRMPDELLPDSDRLPSINGVPRFTRSLVRNRAHQILE